MKNKITIILKEEAKRILEPQYQEEVKDGMKSQYQEDKESLKQILSSMKNGLKTHIMKMQSGPECLL